MFGWVVGWSQILKQVDWGPCIIADTAALSNWSVFCIPYLPMLLVDWHQTRRTAEHMMLNMPRNRMRLTCQGRRHMWKGKRLCLFIECQSSKTHVRISFHNRTEFTHGQELLCENWGYSLWNCNLLWQLFQVHCWWKSKESSFPSSF